MLIKQNDSIVLHRLLLLRQRVHRQRFPTPTSVRLNAANGSLGSLNNKDVASSARKLRRRQAGS